MALLDVSEVIEDPLFTSEVTLTPRAESYDATTGAPVYTDGTSVTLQAVVTNDLKSIHRLPEALQREGTIIVRFCADSAPSFKAKGFDKVTWRGKTFLIKDCADYTHFGRGFLRLVCTPEDSSDGSY